MKVKFTNIGVFVFMRKISSLVAILFVVSAFSIPASGSQGKTNANAFWPGGGFSNSKYSKLTYSTSNAVDRLGYSRYVDDAVNEFDSISDANIGFRKLSSGDGEMLSIVMDEKNSSEYARDAFGIMIPFKIDPKTTSYERASNYETWAYAKIWLNDYMMKQHKFTSDERNKTTIHEIGHAFAMEHQYDGVKSVMVSGQISYPDFSN
ncbi:hypothetical protein [Brevibacillus sp. HD3.3A]|uniref:hypothetical protein n=1 Tax=Brevibacillus sp. HD3.3A TaxID=2738979 RepID=UPI00156BC2E5|nr:hypothetical protein [Brevibacillus sp. HD3.3A]UED67878.1 hypothetical protein HP435_21790 [Brevibacillus sp. HD3.3A]